ncbi:sensor histidine kinase [Sphingomonas sp. I4]
MMIPVAEDAGNRLSVAVDVAMPDFVGDRQLLTQALVNLIGNAIKYGAAGGAIRVSLDACEGGVALRVADDGPGIPPEDRARALRRFGRLDLVACAGGAWPGPAAGRGDRAAARGRLVLDDAKPGLVVSLILPGL